jgi:predicted lipoprotein
MIRQIHLRTRLILLVGCLVMLTGGCTFATIVPLEEAQEVNAGFDATAYVDGIWESELLPVYESDAPDVVTLLAQLAADEEAAIEEFGHRSGTGPYSFMARGEGQVVEIDTSSQAGLARLDLPPYDGEPDVALAIGPVIRGNAIRDAAGFIEYNEFENQMEFAAVYREMNNLVRDNLLSQFDFENMDAGYTLSFIGAFTLGGDEYVIVPVRLEGQD